MKAKKLLIVMATMLAAGQLTSSQQKDANMERLVKLAKQKKAEQAKEAERVAKFGSDVEVEEVVPVVEVDSYQISPVPESITRPVMTGKTSKSSTSTKTVVTKAKTVKPQLTEAQKAELEEKKAREAAKKRKREEDRATRLRYRNMSETDQMEAEVQKIQKRLNQIADNIEKYHETNSMLEKMEKRLDAIEENYGTK